MAFEVIMPKAGMAMEEGTLVQWLKAEGDFVEEGESLLEIMTDKVNMEIEAENSGVLLKILGEEGEVYPVFTVLAYIGEEGEKWPGISSPLEAAAETSGDLAQWQADRSAADRSAADRSAADRSPTDRSAADRSSADRSPTDRSAADHSPTDRSAADRSSADRSPTDRSAADRSPTVDRIFTQKSDKSGAFADAFHTTPARSSGSSAQQQDPASTSEREDSQALPQSRKIRATPAARREAAEEGLNLEEIAGSGPFGRIQKDDVKQAAQLQTLQHSGPAAKPSPSEAGNETAGGWQPTDEPETAESRTVQRASTLWNTPMRGDLSFPLERTSPQKKPRFFSTEEDPMEKTQRIPLTGIRRAIAHRMKESYLTSPMYALTMEVDMSRVKQMLEELKEPMLEERGIRLTVTDFIIKAAAKALKQFPTLNASMEQDHIVLHHHVHIALAVGLENGLMVPVIQNADKKSLAEIAAQSKDLAARAKTGQLKPWEHEGSTFTISNLGVYDIESFTAIINQPNSALLSVGAVTDRVVAKNGAIEILPMMKITANIDHRVTDGATGAQFLQHLRDLLEKPSVIFELK